MFDVLTRERENQSPNPDDVETFHERADAIAYMEHYLYSMQEDGGTLVESYVGDTGNYWTAVIEYPDGARYLTSLLHYYP